MSGRLLGKKLSSYQIIISGFLGVILIGTFLLMLPVSSKRAAWTSPETALFTSTSAVCVTGLVVQDTATCWSVFGQAVILVLIQIGGLGIVTVAAFVATLSGRNISLLQRSMLQDSISAHQIGGIVKLTGFIFKTAFLAELLGALVMLPAFCKAFGASGIWMALFHSISAFCNAGFDVMGAKTGVFSSLTFFRGSAGVSLPVCLLIVFGGVGFLTWDDMVANRFRFKKNRMQSKAILTATAAPDAPPNISKPTSASAAGCSRWNNKQRPHPNTGVDHTKKPSATMQTAFYIAIVPGRGSDETGIIGGELAFRDFIFR